MPSSWEVVPRVEDLEVRSNILPSIPLLTVTDDKAEVKIAVKNSAQGQIAPWVSTMNENSEMEKSVIQRLFQ